MHDMKAKLLGAFAAIALLSACANTNTGATTGTGAVAPAPSGPVPGSQDDLNASVGQYILFEFNSSQLTPEDRSTLDNLAGWLAKNPATVIQIAGNCDERGTEEYNLALGHPRANAARDYLAAKGVNAGRLTTISYGKDRPVDPSSTPEAWAKNRNDTFSVGGGGPSS
jgi:peptidoglycan-associated lipoprotein